MGLFDYETGFGFGGGRGRGRDFLFLFLFFQTGIFLDCLGPDLPDFGGCIHNLLAEL